MEILNQFVNGKTVALVGPAAYMENIGLGSIIDSHDIVVRINRGLETVLTHPKDVGKRTDILYSCLIETSMQAGSLDADNLADNHNIKLICCPPESSLSGISNSTRFHSMINRNTIDSLSKKMPIRIVDHVFHSNLATSVSCRPNTGFLAIYDLLRSKIKKLSLFGFSFYLDGFIPGTKLGVENEKGCTELEFANLAFNSKRHVQKNMWQFAKKTLVNNKLVELDRYLEFILNMEILDKDIFRQNSLS